MKIAYFSPLPPRRTGIANYSKHLAVELARYAEVELFHDGPSEFSELPVCDYLGIPSSLDRLSKFDVLLYHFGNNSDFHLNMWHIFQRHPGVVVLHDAVLYYLMAARGKGGLLRESLGGRATTLTRLRKALKIMEETTVSGRFRGHDQPQNHPCLTSTLKKAKGVVVHSRTAEKIVREAGYSGLLAVIPLLVYQEELEAVDSARSLRLQTRTELGVRRGEILVGSFGLQDKVKRTESLVKAVAKLTPSLPLKLLFAGMGEIPDAQIKKAGVASRILCPGYLSDEDFSKQIAACDVIANLRYPSMGETSATLTQAMTHGKPCIVTDDAWFAELPDDCVWKIPHGRAEVPELSKALEHLTTSAKARRKLGRKARSYICKHHAPVDIRIAYLKVLDEWRVERRVRHPIGPPVSQETSTIAGYFSRRLREVTTFEHLGITSNCS